MRRWGYLVVRTRAGVLEAADLVQPGTSGRVAMFADLPRAADREFSRRGVRSYDQAAFSVKQLGARGVNSVEVILRSVTGTATRL